jgi:hypothetical protein
MYCPKITYCFSAEDLQKLNTRIKFIAQEYHQSETGWFDVSDFENLEWMDEQDVRFTIHLRGRFWKADDPEFDLEYVQLVNNGIVLDFDINIFEDSI